MNLQFQDLIQLQAQLDQKIMDVHLLERKATTMRRIMAFLVELSELANECRAFKYWSLKGPSEKKVLLEEYVDGLHFILSLGIDLHEVDFVIAVEPSETEEINTIFFDVYETALQLRHDFSYESYRALFVIYLQLGCALGCTTEEIRQSYFAKNEKNHERQENQY
ncbi:MAG: dUTP diphosphatase [Erysipelotrichaceae bacterium]